MEFTAATNEAANKQREHLLTKNLKKAQQQNKQTRDKQKQEADSLADEFNNNESSEEEEEEDQEPNNQSTTNMTLEDVITAHQPQLQSMNLPLALWKPLIQKLANQTIDAGTYFGYSYDATQPSHLQYDVHALTDCTKETNVWIIPHIWSFPDEPFAVNALSTEYATALRLAELMGKKEVMSTVPENQTPGSKVVETLLGELQRYAYPLFDSEGQRYYYVMDEFGSRVRMETQTTTEDPSLIKKNINATYGVVQSLLDGFTYTVLWLHENVAKSQSLRRAPQHRLSLLGRGKEAWETRFEYETVYDWYGGWDDGNGELRDIVFKHIQNRATSKCLIVGTGTSTFPLRMCESGYQHVHGTDYVDAVIEKMRKQTNKKIKEVQEINATTTTAVATVASPTWGVMDATDMSSVLDGTYDAVLDKGCMDAMLIPAGSSGKTASGSSWIDEMKDATLAMTELSEVARVLNIGGVFLLFSFHPSPAFINALMKDQLELTNCYEITNLHAKTRVPTTKTFKDMFKVYIFTKTKKSNDEKNDTSTALDNDAAVRLMISKSEQLSAVLNDNDTAGKEAKAATSAFAETLNMLDELLAKDSDSD